MTNLKFTFLLVLTFSGCGYAKKLEINKCIKPNGTVSFQEDRCEVDVYKPLSQKIKKSTVNIIKKNITPLKTAKRINIKAITKSLKPLTKKQKAKSQSFISSKAKELRARVGQFQIIMALPKGWSYYKKVFSNKLYHIKLKNNHLNSDASLMIDFVFPDNKNFSQNEIDELVYLLGSRFVKSSKEAQVNLQNFNVKKGVGAITTFTSNQYMPKYRYTTKGALFKNKWLIQFTLLSNNRQGSSHRSALYTLSQTIKIASTI